MVVEAIYTQGDPSLLETVERCYPKMVEVVDDMQGLVVLYQKAPPVVLLLALPTPHNCFFLMLTILWIASASFMDIHPVANSFIAVDCILSRALFFCDFVLYM
tara:strand:- start:4165 stop:4473 length:309 start_codon:yes stop_codon:yes gene_type:complete